MIDLSQISDCVLPETDLYHPDHPFHHLVLEEIEEMEEAYEAYTQELAA